MFFVEGWQSLRWMTVGRKCRTMSLLVYVGSLQDLPQQQHQQEPGSLHETIFAKPFLAFGFSSRKQLQPGKQSRKMLQNDDKKCQKQLTHVLGVAVQAPRLALTLTGTREAVAPHRLLWTSTQSRRKRRVACCSRLPPAVRSLFYPIRSTRELGKPRKHFPILHTSLPAACSHGGCTVGAPK